MTVYSEIDGDQYYQADDKEYECKTCGKISFSPEEHKSHMEKHEQSNTQAGDLEFKCKACSYKTNEMIDYEQHQKITGHSIDSDVKYASLKDGDPDYNADPIQAPSYDKDTRESFFKSRTPRESNLPTSPSANSNPTHYSLGGDQEKGPFWCKQCGKEYPTFDQIQSHMNIGMHTAIDV